MTIGPPSGERPHPGPPSEESVIPGRTATAPRPTRLRWEPIAATTIGSVHVRDRLPPQDAVLTWADGDRSVIAVSDGHGHSDHFRSDVGAALAVGCAVDVMRQAFDEPVELADRATEVAKRIVQAWVRKVHEHAAADPLPAERATGDLLRPYGATLIVAAVVGDLLLLAQIGDGDTVVVAADGSVTRPLPDDPRHVDTRTGSLCEPDPSAALRVRTLRTSDDVAAPVLVFLCTDGFSAARVDPDWWRQTGEQLLAFSRERGTAWIREQLPGWLEEPASVGGDDTTLAMLIRA